MGSDVHIPTCNTIANETPKERQAILVITIQNFEVNSAVEYLQYCCQYFPSCGK